MSTQSVTAQDLDGEWPSRRNLGPVQDYQSQYMELSAVSMFESVCVCKRD